MQLQGPGTMPSPQSAEWNRLMRNARGFFFLTTGILSVIVTLVVYQSVQAATRYRARFYFDPNSPSMSNGNAHSIFHGDSDASTVVLRVELRFSSGAYRLRAALLDDSTVWTTSNWFTVSDAPHFVELDWRAATAAGANNGGLTLWIDGAQQADLVGVDNDTRRIERIRLGAVAGIDKGTRGTYYFDAFESRRHTYIGPDPGGATPTPTATGTPDPTATSTFTPTPTNAAGPTATATATPTQTPTPLPLDTGFRGPSANAAASGGDGNGFQTDPANAHADDSLFAVDTDSGTGTQTSCTSSKKDKHLFYNYGFSLPVGATITGIEVRLDAWVDSASNSPQMCVQLSWDGGVTWTTAKSTPTLTASEATYLLGSATDTWGRTWSDANFTNANFRVRVINIASSTARDFSLDWVAVKVHYRP